MLTTYRRMVKWMAGRVRGSVDRAPFARLLLWIPAGLALMITGMIFSVLGLGMMMVNGVARTRQPVGAQRSASSLRSGRYSGD